MGNLPKQQVLFAMTGAKALYGGIASNNLNILYALSDLAAEKGLVLTVLSYLEKHSDRPDFLPKTVRFKGFQGNRLKFIFSLLSAATRGTLFCFDHVTLALPLLPLAATGVIETVIFAHGSESWKRIQRTSRWSFQHASLCLTNSHYTLSKMREHILSFNGEACPLGLLPNMGLNKELDYLSDSNLELEAADGKIHPLGERYLLLVARMDPREREKGHIALINALPKLIRDFADVQLVFPGPGGDRNYLKEVAQRKGVASSVFLPGWVSTETLLRLYRDCYAFVMPSKQEGFGLTYLEAMNYGKPCIGCFDQGAEDIIVHGQTGFLIQDPNDEGELLGVLNDLLRDRLLAKSMGKQGFTRLNETFTSRHYQERIKKQIARLL